MPRNIAVAARYANLIPGAADVAAELRREGVKIGSTTGYTREIMAEILPVAAAQGFAPDSVVCTGDTPDGRPTPFMLYKSFLDLQVWPASSAIKVDDTEVGVAEGVNAGAWAVGVAVSGNVFGLSEADAAALAPADFADASALRRRKGSKRLARIMSSTASPNSCPWSHAIEARLASGERP